MNDTLNLLPCPFCGNAGYIRQDGNDPNTYLAGCSECDCELDDTYTVKADAVAAWNTRAPVRSEISEGERICPLCHERWNPKPGTQSTNQIPDDAEFDGTDAAHPAWWRGHEYTANIFCQLVNEILDGKKPTGGISNEPWESLKKRLYALAAPKREVQPMNEMLVVAPFPVEACIAEMEENYQAYMSQGATISASVMNLAKGIVQHYAEQATKWEAQPAVFYEGLFEAACKKMEEKWQKTDEDARFHDVGALRGYLYDFLLFYISILPKREISKEKMLFFFELAL